MSSASYRQPQANGLRSPELKSRGKFFLRGIVDLG
jgi:hypothetical protein